MKIKSKTNLITNSSSETYQVSFEYTGMKLRNSIREILELFGWREEDCNLDKYVELKEYETDPPRMLRWKEENPTVKRILESFLEVLDSIDIYEV